MSNSPTGTIYRFANGITVRVGTGDPEGVVTANVGSLYLRTTGLTYRKVTGSGNTGWIDTSAGTTNKMPLPRISRSAWVNFWPGNQAPDEVGMPALVTVGTMTDGSTVDHSYTKFSTTSQVVLGCRPNVSIFSWQTRLNPNIYFDMITGPSIASIRFFFGLVNFSTYDQDTGNLHYVGFRYSTAVPDPGWVGVCCNGASANHQTSAQIAAIAVNTRYELLLTLLGDGTSASLTVNGGTAVVMATNLPTPATALNWQANGSNLVTEAKNFSLGCVALEWE